MQNFYFRVSVAEQAGLKMICSETPKAGFLKTRPYGKCYWDGRRYIQVCIFLRFFCILYLFF